MPHAIPSFLVPLADRVLNLGLQLLWGALICAVTSRDLFFVLLFSRFFEDVIGILKFYPALFIWSLFFKDFPQMSDDSCLLTSNMLQCWCEVPALSLSGAL